MGGSRGDGNAHVVAPATAADGCCNGRLIPLPVIVPPSRFASGNRDARVGDRGAEGKAVMLAARPPCHMPPLPAAPDSLPWLHGVRRVHARQYHAGRDTGMRGVYCPHHWTHYWNT